jgi:tetratricopeptide (TPR) repeat protein
VALDREDTLKKAEKLLRQGRLENAIAEYLRVVEDQPRDWNTANTLGDLYARANQPGMAVAQYARIADHFFQDGFYPKAAALYKKVLKHVPDDDPAQLRLADISARLGLLKDAKNYYLAVGARRRARGDVRGADEIVIVLGGVDPSDFQARTAAARVLLSTGDEGGAAARFKELYSDLFEKGREAEALDALREAVRLNPRDTDGRALLARAALTAGDTEAAREYLDRETAGDDPALLMALAEVELRGEDLSAAREILPLILTLESSRRDDVAALGWALCESSPDAAFVCIDAAVDAAIAATEFDQAAGLLQDFVVRVPGYIPALLKLVEVCVDGGLETTMYETQARLTDAYLAGSHAAEARVIAEDLVAREPWESAHIERFRRALVMLKVSEPDSVIAERLSGATPFLATDHFSDPLPYDPLPPAPVATVADPLPTQAESAAATRHAAVAQQEMPSSASTSQGHVEIDLTSILGALEEDADLPASSTPVNESKGNPDEVFKDFRTEATRKAAADQSAQHMKLARTYREMGMLDEATTALKNAARSPQGRFEAGSMLGRMYKEQGDLPSAIEWFVHAAEVPAPVADEGRALLYDLAVTLEEAGEIARALAVLLELQGDAGTYRDVAERVARLQSQQRGG